MNTIDQATVPAKVVRPAGLGFIAGLNIIGGLAMTIRVFNNGYSSNEAGIWLIAGLLSILRFNAFDDLLKRLFGRLTGDPLRQPIRVTLGGQVQWRIPRKQAGHPALTIPRPLHLNPTKHPLITPLQVDRA